MTTKSVRIHPRSEHDEMPWRNGGGITYEVARAPRDGEFDWRVSFARVDACGPFSPFPDVDRVITLVSGQTMRLEVTPATGDARYVHDLLAFAPFAFAGEDAVSATPNGRTFDLNVMTARARCRADVEIVRCCDATRLAPNDDTLLVACLDGLVELGDGSGRLEPFDVAQVLRETTVRSGGAAAVIRITTP